METPFNGLMLNIFTNIHVCFKFSRKQLRPVTLSTPLLFPTKLGYDFEVDLDVCVQVLKTQHAFPFCHLPKVI